jgi:hypothetical protein
MVNSERQIYTNQSIALGICSLMQTFEQESDESLLEMLRVKA